MYSWMGNYQATNTYDKPANLNGNHNFEQQHQGHEAPASASLRYLRRSYLCRLQSAGYRSVRASEPQSVSWSCSHVSSMLCHHDRGLLRVNKHHTSLWVPINVSIMIIYNCDLTRNIQLNQKFGAYSPSISGGITIPMKICCCYSCHRNNVPSIVADYTCHLGVSQLFDAI